ncbi:MAG TPA: two-component sensor histidine kinase [Clostridiales bacterium]|nr:two-component sensor histidine kinase [Clostridiales bacterium]
MKHKLSIRWRLFIALEAFTLFVLILLWLLQVVFLDDIYKKIKINEIESSTESLPHTSLEDLKEKLVTYTYEKEICGMIYLPPLLEVAYESHTDSPCALELFSYPQLTEIYQYAKNSQGYYLLRYVTTNDMENDQEKNDYTQNYDEYPYRFPINVNKIKLEMDCMISASIITISSGESYLVVLNSVLSPVSSTIDTLKREYLIISVVLFFVSAVLAFAISFYISGPIRSITRTAKQLAEGNYNVDFTSKDPASEIDELAKTLNYAAKELNQTENLRRELISNVSHDLKTPLTLISGYSEVMRDLPGENSPENLQIIIDETKRLTSLVNDMLDISKLEAGIIVLEKSKLSITGLVSELLERYTKLKEQEGYTIHFDYTENVFVYADEIKMSQVVYNLVNNAVNYTGKDKAVFIRQKIVNGMVRIEVEDTGKGITQEEISAIWDRYYRTESAHQRAPVGTGLGLSIVKKILQLHDAHFGVNSTPGHGSVFWFMLPIVP